MCCVLVINMNQWKHIWMGAIKCDQIKMTSLSVARLDLELGGMNIMWP